MPMGKETHNVDAEGAGETNTSDFEAVRQHLDAYATEAMCKYCHKITGPMGLALENFDTNGGHRQIKKRRVRHVSVCLLIRVLCATNLRVEKVTT